MPQTPAVRLLVEWSQPASAPAAVPTATTDTKPVAHHSSAEAEDHISNNLHALLGGQVNDNTALSILSDVSAYISARDTMAFPSCTRQRRSLITSGTQRGGKSLEPVYLRLADAARWTPARVGDWLRANDLGEFADLFARHDMTGEALLGIDHAVLQSMGVDSAGKRVRILRCVAALRLFA
jgi:hypothetical protein